MKCLLFGIRRRKDIFLTSGADEPAKDTVLKPKECALRHGAVNRPEEIMKKKINYLYAVLALSLIISIAMGALGLINTQTAEAAAAAATMAPTATYEAEVTAMAQPLATETSAPTAVAVPAYTAAIASTLDAAPVESEATATPAASETPAATAAPAASETPEPTPVNSPQAEVASGTERGGAPSAYVPLDENQLKGGYTVENARFGIDSTGANARATTDGINAALFWAKDQGYTTIKFETGTYMVQCNWRDRCIAPTDGILVPSGLTLDLGGSTFKMEPNSYPEYCIFGIVSASDVTIKNGTLIGDLDNHVFEPSSKSPTHEYGFGVCISASTNVTIKNLTISKMTGDGIIVEGSYSTLADGGSVSTKIRLLNNDISNCRRQGISVIGMRDSEIAGNKIYNISGADPQYGIDIEKELDYIVDKLSIHDNVIYGCSGGAISCHSGTDYEVYNNVCSGNILTVYSAYIKLYGNTIKDSFIQVMRGSSNITVENNIMEGNSWVQID
jgi:hypothetical protein